MDYDNLDEETIQKRRKEQIEARTKKHFSTMFTLVATVFEIIETVIIMFALFFLAAFIMFKVLGITSERGQSVFAILIVVIFFAGLVIGFLVFKKAIRFVIKKRHLKDKLADDILIHYFKDEEIKEL